MNKAGRNMLLVIFLELAGGMFATAASAAAAVNNSAAHDHQSGSSPAAQAGQFTRSEASYVIPTLTLLRQDGSKADFPAELDDGRPVILTFIFTSCTSICPVLTHVFAEVQKKLGREREKVHLVSVSIDPEYDTPAHLADYARKFKAGPQWQYYTGPVEASVAMQKAFGAYLSYDKMDHLPLIFLREAPGKPWLRLEGLVSADQVISEYHNLAGHQ